MFSGKKFRLWSRQPPAAKKETDREQQTRTKNRSAQQTKADSENITTIASIVSPLYHDSTQQQVVQKLREDNSRLEEIIKELTPYKIQAVALEKKLIATTKAFEKKEIKYTASISSLEYENERLREEIKRARLVCSGCYFCARTQQQQQQFQHNQEPLSAKLFASPLPPSSKEFPSSRNDDGSNDSMQSGESWRRLERLEETQSAIFKETSRQKQETSRCLQQITNELVKALTSQKSLRQDCTQMQDRICHLEKQNERLNKIIFRQYTPSSSTSSSLQTRHPTVRRNEQPVVIARSEVGQTVFWSDFPSQKISSTDVKTGEENNPPTPAQEAFSSSPYARPHHNRFRHETTLPEKCASNENNHIPEEIVQDNAMSTAMDDNTNRGIVGGDSAPSKHLDTGRSSSRESEPMTGRNLCWSRHHRENANRDVCGWDASASSVSVSTLQDDTEEQRCDDTRQKRGSNYSLNDILDGDIDELRLSIQNLEDTRQEKKRSSRNLQCSINEVFEEPVKMPGQAHSGHSSSVERGKRYSLPGSPLVKSGPTPEKQLMLSEALGGDGAAQKPENCENLLPDKQERLEAALQKIESVINNGSTNEIGRNNDSSLNPVEYQSIDDDHTVTDTNTEDATSDDDLVWNSIGKDRRFGDLRQEEEKEEERALLQSDSQTDVSESDQNDEISALVGDDNTSEEGRFVSELNARKPQTSQQERETAPVSQNFQTESLHPDNSTNEEEKQCVQLTDRQAMMEANPVSKNDRKLETSESGKLTMKSEEKISIRRHSLPNDNLSNDNAKKEIAVSKDMVTALTAYFEEVQAEHYSSCQQSTPKSRSSSFASRSSSDSKESSSFDDNDTSNTCIGIHDQTDEEFRTIRHQRSAGKVAEETEAHKRSQIHETGSEKTLMEDPSVETEASRSKPSESELVTGGGCIQPSQSTELDHHQVDSTPDFISPVDLIAVSQVKSQHDETSSLQEPLEQAPQGSGALLSLQEEEDGKVSLACTNEIVNTSMMATGCELDDQTHCQSLSSTVESASPLHVNYVRTCSLKSFWDVVTPPSSPRVEKLDEGKMFSDPTMQHDAPDHADKTAVDQVHGSSDSQDDCVWSKSHGEEPLEREITPVSTEDGENHSQNYPPLPLLGQPSSGMANITKARGNFQDDCRYGIPIEDLSKCEFPESRQQPEALRHEFTERFPDGKFRGSGGNEAEHISVLSCVQSDLAEPSGINEEQREASSGGTLTEKDIRKYQLGCHDNSGHQQGCHDGYSGNDAAGEDLPWLPMQQITEMDCSENQRGLSSKPPIPPKRFHSMLHYARDSSNLDQEIPDYEELHEDDDDLSYNSDRKRYHGAESSPYDNRRHLTLESERYVFHYPKWEAHVPGLPTVSTSLQTAFEKNPVQFRTYSKSWDSGKRNSYPAARFRSYSQPEEQWDNVASLTDSARHYPVHYERNVRPLSAYQVLNTSSRGFTTDVPSRVSPSVRQQWQRREENQKSKDAENDLVFHEITKQIESLQQTVSELQNRGADSNSIF